MLQRGTWAISYILTLVRIRLTPHVLVVGGTEVYMQVWSVQTLPITLLLAKAWQTRSS